MQNERYQELINGVENSKVRELSKAGLEEIRDLIIKRNRPIYRLNAHFSDYDGYYFSKLTDFGREQAVKKTAEKLKELPVPPGRIFIFKRSDISADWYPPFPLNFSRVEDYLTVLDNFQTYVDSFEFADGTINTGMFADSPSFFEPEEKFYDEILGVEISSKKNNWSIEDLKNYDDCKKEVEVVNEYNK